MKGRITTKDRQQEAHRAIEVFLALLEDGLDNQALRKVSCNSVGLKINGSEKLINVVKRRLDERIDHRRVRSCMYTVGDVSITPSPKKGNN